MTAERAYSILRIRPLPIMAEGFSSDRLHAIARSFARGAAGDGRSETFPVPLDVEAFDTETISGLTGLLTTLTQQSNVVLIDMDYDRAGGRYSVVDILLFQAMRQLPDTSLRGRQILIIVTEPLAPTDDLQLLAEDARFRGSVIIVDSSGRPSTAEPPPWFAEAENPKWIELHERRKSFAGKILRSRGVFRTSSRANEFQAYHYSADRCAEELDDLLTAYLDDRRTDFVVYDDTGPSWFCSAVKAACVAAGRNAYTIDDLRGVKVAGEEALDAVVTVAARDLANREKRVAVIAPAYKTGRRIAELWRVCREHGRVEPDVLAVLCHHPAEAVDSGLFSTTSVHLDGIEVDLDFFTAVDIALLPESSWQVRAARRANEIQPMSGPWRKPSSVSMLALFDQYGSDVEYEIPSTRRGIRTFPQLRDLDEWDSLWLAEALIRSIEIELGCLRSQLLVVAPDEGTAIRRISEAIERRLAVAIAKIERPVLKDERVLPTKVANIIRRYQSRKIALLDESSVTYRTLHDLDGIVLKTIERPADISASVVELPVDAAPRPERMLSLIRWNPLLLATRKGRRGA